MPWTVYDFPDAFKNFNPEVRDKMIEIANALLIEEEYEESKAIPIAIEQAKEWARNRGIKIEDDNELS
ncbi:MAG: DUF2188 domain-containing protein [Chloroflexi bacterium]|nr:DUF2188 domain-containing protein [Chloroflexota bacterium]